MRGPRANDRARSGTPQPYRPDISSGKRRSANRRKRHPGRTMRHMRRIGISCWQWCSHTIGALWSLAMLDVLLWRRMPFAILSMLIPPLGMTLLLVVLSLTVTQEPVALVIQSHGPYAKQMAEIIESDTDAYALSVTNLPDANHQLYNQEIAAIIIIPPDFDRLAPTHTANLEMTLNNIDIDFADDIRRSVDRSIGQFNAPSLTQVTSDGSSTANPYHIVINEHDLRHTNVSFLDYQVLPVLILLILSTGMMGTALLCAQDIERGTARHLVLAPVATWTLVAGRLLGGFLLALIVLIPALALCLLTGIIAPPADRWFALCALLAVTALCASGMGAILSTFMHGTRNIAMASSILATYLFFLGGGFTTIAFLPAWLRAISAFDPIRYSIDGMRQALFYPDLLGFSSDLLIPSCTALLAVLLGSLLVRYTWNR